jgi:PadR family transcriptional regulator, regulatory protein PadR
MPAKSKIGPFEHLVLEAVDALQTRAYGSRVYEKACELAEDEVNVGSIYVTLERLYKKGYLSATDAKPTGERGWQPTKIYKITPEGDAALEASAKSQERLFLSYLTRKREWIPDLSLKLRQLLKKPVN